MYNPDRQMHKTYGQTYKTDRQVHKADGQIHRTVGQTCNTDRQMDKTDGQMRRTVGQSSASKLHCAASLNHVAACELLQVGTHLPPLPSIVVYFTKAVLPKVEAA